MDLKNLKKTRASFKSKLTIFKSYLEPLLSCHTLNNLQNHELNTRFIKIQDMYNDFDSVQTDIENLTEIPGDEHTERENFETSYFGALAAAQELLSRHTAAGAASAAPEDNLVTGSNVVTALTGGPNIKLPTTHLPTFSGRYQDWLEYHDTYKSLIHDNQSIPIIHKFHYLRSSLKDGASLVIKSLEFSSDNYKVAWDLLCERYTNDRILVNNHLNALFNINPVLQESSRALRNTIDLVNKNLRALKTLNLPTEHWDILIIHMVTSKLDSAILRDWETERNNIKKLPTLTEFTTFLRNRADLLETMEEAQTLNKPRRHSDITHNRPKSFLVNHAQNQTQYKYKCPVCKNNHSIYQCTKFKTMPVESRINKVNQLNLCTNCLRSGHDEQRCRLSSCRLCTQRHNTMLHINNQAKADPKSSTSKPNDCVASPTLKEHTQAPQQITNSAALCSTFGSHRVPLSTAVINVSDYDGHTHQVRVLLDNGSISSFITKDLQAKLKLPTYSTSISVTGLEKKRSSITEHCDVTITSRTQDYTAEVNCFVVQEITDMIPFTKLNCDSFTIPPHIHLADPNFHEPSEVQMLLGAELFWECITYNHISLGKKKPVLVETTLGWLVAGSIHTQNSKQKQPYTVHCNLINNIELDAKLDKFFELESVPSTQQIHTKGESECERIFTQTTTRHPDGKFVVTIPLKESPECLGDSKTQALLRFQALERKFKRNPEFKQKYIEFIDEYLRLGHMSENTDIHTNETSYFLPHHAICRESSLTSRLRTVFDGSAVSSSGKSFNDIQYVGPTVQDDLLSILIRFRQHKFVVTSDVQKMYRQIYVTESQRSLQQILWRSDTSQPIKQYKLNTVTYGTSSAPYLATRCLVQLGQECAEKNVSETILHDFYVDDYISGNDDKATLLETCRGVIKTLESAHFHLRKWRSNAPSLLDNLVADNSSDELFKLDTENHSKTLGLLWSCQSDELLFSVTENLKPKPTNKRSILSTIATIFDPLGLINPCLLPAKLILQSLWAKNISWEGQLPEDIEAQWNNFAKQIPEIVEIRIPRRIICDFYVKVELHAFSDASNKAYASCIYLRSISNTGQVSVHLALAKSKIAPLKQKLSTPRLELLGALLSIQLAKKVKNSLRLNIDSQHFWSDSTIVLCWIKTCKQQLKQFVYNRITEISNNSDPIDWHYVPTTLNPADIGSRGQSASNLKNSLLWWEGPPFLHETEIQWPTQPQNLTLENLPEVKIQCHVSTEQCEDNFTSKYSNFCKLQRIVAYMNRFVHNCKNVTNKNTGPLKVSELNLSLQMLCKQVQTDKFSEQLSRLLNKRPLSHKDTLLKFNPFVDTFGIMRVGGRLASSYYDYNTKHPILLHASHHITKILVHHYHRMLMHTGPQLMLATLRHRYWIINGRNLCRQTSQSCITCLRYSGKTHQPIMGNLPLQRVQSEYVFANTSCDYAGPILIASRKGRGCQTKKAYIVVFVCLAVRAVHLELVTDLTAMGFIAALNRFIARRGKPATILSDNGTCFIGACNELAKFLKNNSEEITSYSATKEIEFKFCPAYSPHFNGLAEGAVKQNCRSETNGAGMEAS
ncbi:uncharacterized protein LOC133520037 [Cydia pomonella]|uniref:uncharacterized protein LOC133520037 n=1 Tax=Cydia pomonella TaxID=82600 RepID=UPI002ADE773E|nr:uncharacterized protein LOC133520037 [Cydia pomonella]